MPKGHSARPASLRDQRYLLEREPRHGQVALAGIALSYATGISEHTGRLIASRILHLRHEHAHTDADVLRLLNPPRVNGNGTPLT